MTLIFTLFAVSVVILVVIAAALIIGFRMRVVRGGRPRGTRSRSNINDPFSS